MAEATDRSQEVFEAYEKQRDTWRQMAERGTTPQENADRMVAILDEKEANQRKAEGLPARPVG